MPVRDLLVPDGDVALAVRVHSPEPPAEPSGPLPAVVVTGSWLTVKEQMPDLYAARLANDGFVAITFDYAGFGASGGGLRQAEIPVRKMRNLAAVVDWLRSQSDVDATSIGVLGVCASAQYALGALARGLPVASFASVAGWFHDTDTVAPFYGGPEGVADRLARADSAARELLGGADRRPVPAYGPGDDRAAMAMEMDYYASPERGAVPSWRNEMDEVSWAHWLTFDAFAAIPDVRVPCLFVHSDDSVLPDNVRTIAERLGDLATVDWTTGQQTDFYDQPDQVAHATRAAARHFRAHAGSAGGSARRDGDAAVHRFFRAVDARDWDTVSARLADQVRLDYTSLFDGEPEVLPGAEVVERWRGLLPGFDATVHLLGPLVHVGATVQCNVRGYHHLDDQTWMVAGWYTLTLGASDEDSRGPRLTGITLDVSYEEGDRALAERAQARAGDVTASAR